MPLTVEIPIPETGTHRGHRELPKGTLVLSFESPRPLRLWFGTLLVVDEPVSWRRYGRTVRGTVIVPVEAGRWDYRVEVGPRPEWPSWIDEHCPSRNREQVRQALRQAKPDVLKLEGEVVEGVRAPAVSLRHLPTQVYFQGVGYQRVVARPLPGFFRSAPAVDSNDSTLFAQPTFALVSPVSPFEAREVTTAAEAGRGLKAFLVPVSNAQQPVPAARTQPRETTRVEPESQVVELKPFRLELVQPRQEPLNFLWKDPPVDPTPAEVSFPLPVFEQRGRLAPLREYRDLPFPPDVAALLKLVPRPVLPPTLASFGALYDYAWDMLFRLKRDPRRDTGMVSYYFKTAIGGFPDDFFVWDSSFTALALNYGHRALAPLSNLDNHYARQFDGGYMHREQNLSEGTASAFEPDFSPNPPLLTLVEWSHYQLTGNAERLKSVYPALAANHRWIEANRKLPDGTYWTTGLANGLDNSPSLGEGYPDLTAQMVHEAELLAQLARLSGLEGEAKAFEEERRITAEAMNAKLWSDPMRFYSTSLAEGGHNPNKIITGFWPLWTGLVPPQRVEALADHLLDPASFNRPHPVPSLAADSPHFVPGGEYWKGSVWAPTNCAVIQGFERAGRHDLAVQTLTRHLQALVKVRAETGVLWENYSSEAITRGSTSCEDYSWTAVGPITLLLEIFLGLKPDAPQRTLTWRLPEEGGCGVENYPLGAATLSLRQNLDPADPGNRILEVNSDRAFRLVIDDGVCQREHLFSAGPWTGSLKEEF